MLAIEKSVEVIPIILVTESIPGTARRATDALTRTVA